MKFSLKLSIIWLLLSKVAFSECTSKEELDLSDEMLSSSEAKLFEHNNPLVSIKCRIMPQPQNGKCVEGSCMTASFTVDDVQACLDDPEGGCMASHGVVVEGICKQQNCISKHGQRDIANKDCIGNID